MEWSNTMVLNLIDLYRENECLWNPTHDNYKNKLKKLDAWNTIADYIKCDVGEVKKKMESLLGSFRRERQKQESRTGMGAEEKYHSTWFAFKSMAFLLDKFAAKKTIDTEEILEEQNSTVEELEQGIETPIETINDNNTTAGETSTSTGTRKRKSVFQSSGSKDTQSQNTRAEEAYKILKDAVEKRNQKDPSAIYGDHIASKHRTYSKQTKSIVEHLFANILFNADMGNYDSNSLHASIPSIANITPIPSPSPHSDHHSYGSESGCSSVAQGLLSLNTAPILSHSQSNYSSTQYPPNVSEKNYTLLLPSKTKFSQTPPTDNEMSPPSPQSEHYNDHTYATGLHQISESQNNVCPNTRLIPSSSTIQISEKSNCPVIVEYINNFSG